MATERLPIPLLPLTVLMESRKPSVSLALQALLQPPIVLRLTLMLLAMLRPILMLTPTRDRRLRPDARSVQNAADERGLCSMADSRLAVYEDVNLATEFW